MAKVICWLPHFHLNRDGMAEQATLAAPAPAHLRKIKQPVSSQGSSSGPLTQLPCQGAGTTHWKLATASFPASSPLLVDATHANPVRTGPVVHAAVERCCRIMTATHHQLGPAVATPPGEKNSQKSKLVTQTVL